MTYGRKDHPDESEIRKMAKLDISSRDSNKILKVPLIGRWFTRHTLRINPECDCIYIEQILSWWSICLIYIILYVYLIFRTIFTPWNHRNNMREWSNLWRGIEISEMRFVLLKDSELTTYANDWERKEIDIVFRRLLKASKNEEYMI